MNKAQLIDAIASKTSLSKVKSKEVLETMLDTVGGAMKKGERLAFPGFGSFYVSERKARTGRNPRTGEMIKIKAKKVVKFKPSSKLVM
jgi:DNA-binding protein HU-beta